MTWQVNRLIGPASDHHLLELDLTRSSLWRFDVTRPAAVLGSVQPADLLVSSAVERFDVVRRRSGGGLVLMDPGEQLWVDVVLPRLDPKWTDDVSEAAAWLGEVWVRALGVAVGARGSCSVHRGPPVARAEGRVVCFAGVGAGEVLLDGRKVVGISQRRARDGARFQCVVFRSFDVDRYRSVVDATCWTDEIEMRITHRVAAIADLDAVFAALVEQLTVDH